MVKKSLLCLAILAAPAVASAKPCVESESEKLRSRSLLAGGDAFDAQRKWSFEISVAPEIARHRALRTDTGTGDATGLGWTLAYEDDIGFGDLELQAGPSVTADSDSDSEEASSFGASAKLTFAPVGPVSPFVAYGFEKGYDRFFDGEATNEHVFEAGLSCHGGDAVGYGLEIAGRWTEADGLGEDYAGARITAEIDTELVEGILGFHADAEFQRRWYRGNDPRIMAEQRYRSLEAFAGFNLVGALNRALHLEGEEQVISDATIGVRWAENRSNIDEEDESNLKLAPAFAIKVHF